jgi:hypothetical protein
MGARRTEVECEIARGSVVRKTQYLRTRIIGGGVTPDPQNSELHSGPVAKRPLPLTGARSGSHHSAELLGRIPTNRPNRQRPARTKGDARAHEARARLRPGDLSPRNSLLAEGVADCQSFVIGYRPLEHCYGDKGNRGDPEEAGHNYLHGRKAAPPDDQVACRERHHDNAGRCPHPSGDAAWPPYHPARRTNRFCHRRAVSQGPLHFVVDTPKEVRPETADP